MLVVNPIVICIRYRATMPLSAAGLQRALIFFVRDTVFVGIFFLFGRRRTSRRQPDGCAEAKHLVVKGAGIGSIIETGQSAAEIAIQNDFTQFKTCLCVHPKVKGLIGIRAFSYSDRIGHGGILVGALGQAFVGDIAAIEKADIGACADEKAVLGMTV